MSRDPSYLTTAQGRITYANQAFLTFFGYSWDEVKNKKVQDFYINIQDRKKFQEEIEKSGFVEDHPVRLSGVLEYQTRHTLRPNH